VVVCLSKRTSGALLENERNALEATEENLPWKISSFLCAY
jgi:hypothetical protein